MAITAGMVKELRAETGLPMMECKKALEEAGGDKGQAIELLRKKGLSQISKRAERETSEGRVTCFTDDPSGRTGMAVMLCETAPVASTDDFIQLAELAAKIAATQDDPTPESVMAAQLPDGSGSYQDHFNDVVNRIRENVKVAEVASYKGDVGHYIHHNAQVGVLVEFSGPCPPELAADVCMHIAAMKPAHTRREDVDPKLVEQERQIAAEQAAGKPPQIIDKIVEGKLDRWYSEIVLLEQPFVKEEKQSVSQILNAASDGLTVKRFARLGVRG